MSETPGGPDPERVREVIGVWERTAGRWPRLRPPPFDGLPEDAPRVFMLRTVHRSQELAAEAHERMAAWTPADRALFETRFGAILPAAGE